MHNDNNENDGNMHKSRNPKRKFVQRHMIFEAEIKEQKLRYHQAIVMIKFGLKPSFESLFCVEN